MKNFYKVTILTTTILLGLGFQGCAKKKGASSAADAGSSSTGQGSNQGSSDNSGNSNGSTNFTAADLPSFTTENVLANINMISIYFDYDQSSLREMDRKFLKVLNEALKMEKNKNISLKIDGNCDERGSNEYNLALGERRARAVYEYLINLGTNKSRLDLVSFGEEKPADMGHDEAAWAKNRRAGFTIKN